MGRLDGKTAVITGAAGGIGEVVAELFAKEGANIVATDMRAAAVQAVIDRIKASGGEGFAAPADITKYSDVEKAMDAAAAQYGGIDILCNIAGIADRFFTTTSIEEALWDQVYEINQKGVFYASRAALKYMAPAGSGSIVNVSSIAGVFGTLGVAYSATKAAIIGISKNIAVQFAGTGIRCNVVAPGPTKTPMADSADSDDEMMARANLHFNRHIPPCDPIDQANAMLFFASDDAKAVTGQVLIVDKGRTL
ncbi:MAG: SDR family oxidoreductase [Clostridiales Family XIII bacterium]|jgi:NAD(P)-dependent dehydrogenase (short-subunit alcohol dehydrogenase family)|nr:SDR family oxidoreductase [Clostridiales Family XIII bacterium]